jgi:hypothetical protein
MATYKDFSEVPIIVKSKEILSLTDAIVQSIDEEIVDQNKYYVLKPEDRDNAIEYLKFLKQEMMGDAYTITVKLQTAHSVDLYTHKMEYATLIKLSARSLLTHTSGLKMYGYKRTDYLELLRNAIEEFRILFVEWLGTFDKYNDIPDGWGLFYDPEHEYEMPEWNDEEEDMDDDIFWNDDGEDDDENELPDWMKDDEE